jgi:mevalonate kinase
MSTWGSGCGKLILLGEHAVVYGHPAIAVGLSKQTEVILDPRPGPTRIVEANIQDARLTELISKALPPEGLAVRIRSELPTGRGMGSSAALCVALIRAREALTANEPTLDEIHAAGFELEAIFHGTPSGIDHAVAAHGGALFYRKGEEPEILDMPPIQAVVLDSGRSGNTAQMVAAVADRRPSIDFALAQLGEFAGIARNQLSDTTLLGELMIEAHALLKTIGVSTQTLDELVALSMANGAIGAKLSGAGGGGVVIALCPENPDALLQAALDRGIQAFTCTLPRP